MGYNSRAQVLLIVRRSGGGRRYDCCTSYENLSFVRLTALKVAGPCGHKRGGWGLAGRLGQADTLNPSSMILFLRWRECTVPAANLHVIL